jgi:hypothetical protein
MIKPAGTEKVIWAPLDVETDTPDGNEYDHVMVPVPDVAAVWSTWNVLCVVVSNVWSTALSTGRTPVASTKVALIL